MVFSREPDPTGLQIWIALCVCLMLAYLKFSSQLDLSMQKILRLLQLNLFMRRDLWVLLRGAPPDDERNVLQGDLAL